MCNNAMVLRIALYCLLVAGPLSAQQRAPAELLKRRGFAWRTDSAEHFILHADTSARAVRSDLLLFRLDRALARARVLTGTRADSTRIHVFAVGSRARMKTLVGRRTNGIAYHRTATVGLVITSDWAASAAHEVFHVVAMRGWGPGPVWLNEGMAVFADDQWRGSKLHDAARTLAAANRLASFARLVRKFRDLDENVAYPQAGSFAQYLYERYGRAVIRVLWREDLAAVQKLTGKDVVQLEREWRAFLEPD